LYFEELLELQFLENVHIIIFFDSVIIL